LHNVTHPSARQSEIEREARRKRVASLLLAGVRDQTRIAEQLGTSQPTVSRDIKAIEAEWAASAVQDIAAAKGHDLERIERLIAALWGDAIKGKWLATDRVLALMQHRAKLLGLEAPERLDLSGKVGITREYTLITESED
jgi:predicted transcriptional regulator